MGQERPLLVPKPWTPISVVSGAGLRACRRVMEEVARSPQLTPTPGADTLVHLMRLSRVRLPPPPTTFSESKYFRIGALQESRST